MNPVRHIRRVAAVLAAALLGNSSGTIRGGC
jgi:hypothetical protein